MVQQVAIKLSQVPTQALPSDNWKIVTINPAVNGYFFGKRDTLGKFSILLI